MGVGAETLEDATQDVFLTVHQRWDSYDPARARVETWVFGILLRVASYYRRKERRRLARIVPWSKEGTRESLVPSGEAPAEVVAKRQAAHLLDQLLDELSPDKRAVLVLVDVEQCTVPEAALALKINLNTAYWRLRQARAGFERSLARVRAAERRPRGGEEAT
jgi:RNA polymerase sigma-70 factor (ECF subfamily)